jgi:hypothetical protein
MKLIHSLVIVGLAAGLGATSQSLAGRRARTEPTPSPSAQVQTVPWLTDAWSDDTEDVTVTDPHAGLYMGDELGEDPHAGLGVDGDAPVDGADYAGSTCPAGGAKDSAASGTRSVERSSAANGKTVAEVFAGRAVLAEQRIRVRGTVVKLTENILGKTYLHLEDGSGSEGGGDADLAVTTTQPFELGETVEIEGRLAIDQDVGVGYVYAALLGDAIRVRP